MDDGGACLLLRNLRKFATHGMLRSSLLQLMNEVVLVDIPLRERDISIEGEADETKIGLIYFRSRKDLNKALRFVDSYDNRRRLTFNFDDVIEPSKRCAVIPVFYRPSKYYIEGETVFNPDETKEFKSGVGLYVNVQMRDDLSKFMCACINSGKERVFTVGIQENGCVTGVPLTPQKQDIVKLDIIEQAARDIRPPVMPWNYKVEFIQILANGIIKDGLKVIEITVNASEPIHELSEVKGEYYIQRDGGKIESMKQKDVKQWYQQVMKRSLMLKDEERKDIVKAMDKLKKDRCVIL